MRIANKPLVKMGHSFVLAHHSQLMAKPTYVSGRGQRQSDKTAPVISNYGHPLDWFGDELKRHSFCEAEADNMNDAFSTDADVTRHMDDAVPSLTKYLATDKSIRFGHPINLGASQ